MSDATWAFFLGMIGGSFAVVMGAVAARIARSKRE